MKFLTSKKFNVTAIETLYCCTIYQLNTTNNLIFMREDKIPIY